LISDYLFFSNFLFSNLLTSNIDWRGKIYIFN
jgi:hypothetical protein